MNCNLLIIRKTSNLRYAALGLSVFPFLMPSRLNRFQLALIGLLRIAGESGQFRDPLVHVSESHGIRINVGELVRQPDRNVFHVVPIKRRRHVAPYLFAVSLSAHPIPSRNSCSTPESPPRCPSSHPAPSGSRGATSA